MHRSFTSERACQVVDVVGDDDNNDDDNNDDDNNDDSNDVQ